MDEEARKFIANKGYDIQYGARPLKRAIQTHVEAALAEVILGGEIEEGNTIRGTYDKEKDALVMVVEKKNPLNSYAKMSDFRVWHFFCCRYYVRR